LIDQVLIDEQFGISKEGRVDATNATFDEAKSTLKKKQFRMPSLKMNSGT
jgi:hypothetical protein